MDECFLYRNPPFSFPYAGLNGLFNPLRNFHDPNQFAITGPDGDTPSKKHEETRKRKEKKRMSQILYSDNRRQRLNERLRAKHLAKLENRKSQDDEKMDTKSENTILSEEDLVTLFDAEDKPKKRKRKKRKNRKKKKKVETKETSPKGSTEQTINKHEDEIVSEAGTPAAGDPVPTTFATTEGRTEKPSEADAESIAKDEQEFCQKASQETPQKAEQDNKRMELELVEETVQNIAGEISSKCEEAVLSCGESSTSSAERSTSEHKEAGETVSNDEADENHEEERSTISLEERGSLTEMLIDDEFPWHLYQTDDVEDTVDPDEGFTVVRRKEKRQRKRKVSPIKKKKRKSQRRPNRRPERKKKDRTSPKKTTTPIKNSPRNACPIRPVIIKNERPPETPKPNKGDPTSQTPSVPPGFAHTNGNISVCPSSLPTLTKPFEQLQSVNALFMRMPTDTIITVPFVPLETMASCPDILPMKLDLTYPDCNVFISQENVPIEYMMCQPGVPQY